MTNLRDTRILVDCDGVLLNWSEAFISWATHYEHLTLKKDADKCYPVEDKFEEEDVIGWQLVHRFNTSDYIAMLDPIEGAVEHVRKLVEDGYDFHAITSLGQSPQAYRNRKDNLEAVFGEDVFVALTCLSVFETKENALSAYKDTGCWWIEDHPKNATMGHEAGLNSILIHDEHNADFEHSDIHRARDWKDIYNIISNG